jgi:hypothetical protein
MPSNFPFQPEAGIHTSNLIADTLVGLATPCTSQKAGILVFHLRRSSFSIAHAIITCLLPNRSQQAQTAAARKLFSAITIRSQGEVPPEANDLGYSEARTSSCRSPNEGRLGHPLYSEAPLIRLLQTARVAPGLRCTRSCGIIQRVPQENGVVSPHIPWRARKAGHAVHERKPVDGSAEAAL